MKKITPLLALTLAASAFPASAALIAGWETWADTGANINPATQLGTGITATADGTPEAGGSWFLFNNATVANGASNDGTYGSLGSPAASSSTTNTGDGYALANGFDGFIDFTLTNTSTNPVDLTSFNFDSGAFRPRAARNWELSVLPGSAISVGSVTSGGPVTNATAPISDDYDIDLSGLTDSLLDPSGSVTFRLNFTGGTNSSSGHHLFLDNVGVFGDPVPEPSSLSLLAIFVSGSLLRRRRVS